MLMLNKIRRDTLVLDLALFWETFDVRIRKAADVDTPHIAPGKQARKQNSKISAELRNSDKGIETSYK